MNDNQISVVREDATEAIIGYYRNLVETTEMTIDDIKEFPDGHDFIAEQVKSASILIGKPQVVMMGFALSGYTSPDDTCYTVVCLMDDADNRNALAGEVQNIIEKIEAHHSKEN